MAVTHSRRHFRWVATAPSCFVNKVLKTLYPNSWQGTEVPGKIPKGSVKIKLARLSRHPNSNTSFEEINTASQ